MPNFLERGARVSDPALGMTAMARLCEPWADRGVVRASRDRD